MSSFQYENDLIWTDNTESESELNQIGRIQL